MKPEKRARQLERAGLAAAQKAVRRHPGTPVTRDELLGLRVQTLTVSERVVFGTWGAILIAGGAGLFAFDIRPILGIVAIVLGVLVFIFGVIGWRRTLRTAVDTLGDGLAELVVQTILCALD